MPKTLGSSGQIELDIGSGDDLVAYIKNASFSISADEVEVTDNDSSQMWKEFLMGNRSGAFSFTCNAGALVDTSAIGVDGDAVNIYDLEQALIASYLAGASYGTALAWAYSPHGPTTDYRRYSFNGYIQEISHDMSNNEVVELSVTVRITGAIAVGVVA
jgi:regulation of enolase protein 1 (concanavalin A-like superfamily)